LSISRNILKKLRGLQCINMGDAKFKGDLFHAY
ncbi:hypothetical protein T4D_537, partial [Trichinella pseudospiralis]